MMKKISLVFSILAFSLAACQSSTTTEIASVNDMEAIDFNQTDKVLIDVRTPEEFAAGHLPNALNIDVKSDDFNEKIKELDKDKTYYIYCKTGVRSTQAVEQFKAAGFEHLINLKDGYTAYEK